MDFLYAPFFLQFPFIKQLLSQMLPFVWITENLSIESYLYIHDFSESDVGKYEIPDCS